MHGTSKLASYFWSLFGLTTLRHGLGDSYRIFAVAADQVEELDQWIYLSPVLSPCVTDHVVIGLFC